MGSRLLAGSDALAKALETTVDDQNISFIDAASSAGYLTDPAQISTVFLKKGSYSAFLELHIEQGPILEEEGMSFWFYFINSSDLFQTSYMIYTLGTWILMSDITLQSRYIYWSCDCNCSPC